MKNLIAIILSLVAVGSIAKADHVLVYRGYQYQNYSNAGKSDSHAYYVFDLDSSEYASVVLSGTTYTASGATTFSNSPVITKGGASETDFGFGAAGTSGSNFNFQFGFFSGKDKETKLSDTYTAEIASILTFSGHYLHGNGTTAGDVAASASGIYQLDFALTEESAAGNSGTGDTLEEAVGLVTARLDGKGFSEAP